MKKLLPPLVLAVAFLIWWLQPERVFKRHVRSFLETAEVPENMSDAGRSARGPNLAEYLAPSVSAEPPEDLAGEVPAELSRDEIAALYSAVASHCRSITIESVEFVDLLFSPDRAEVTLRFDAIVDLPSRRPVDGIQTAHMSWIKQDGDWLLRSVSWTESAR